jgi:Protein of unknown function (DUF2459)
LPARACTALLVVALLAGWGSPRRALASALADSSTEPNPVVLYLVRRSWHIDVGFAARDLDPSLAAVARRFPEAKYLFFGFGDRHYLLSKGKGTSTLAGALFPGPGLILVTAIENLPTQAFGGSHVLEFGLTTAQAAAAQGFVRRALEDTDFPVVAAGPYDESAYYGATASYSALHTCNTWAAEALRAAGLDVRTHFVVFAGQTWSQARKAQKRAYRRATTSLVTARPTSFGPTSPEGVLAQTPVNQSQGGGLPF